MPLFLLAALIPTLSLAQAPPVGDTPLSLKDAVRFFRAACLDTYPGHAGARAALLANGFAPNPGTPTWYHPRLDLSVQVDAECTMVFVSEEDAGALARVLATSAAAADGGEGGLSLDPDAGSSAAQGPAGSEFTFEPVPTEGGESYYRAALWPPR